MSLVPKQEDLPQRVRQRDGAGHPMIPGGKSTGFTFSGKDFMRMLRRRKWLISLSVVLFSITSVFVTFLWLKYAPRYTARSFLAVNPPKPTELRGVQNLLNKDIMERYLQSYAQDMQSRTIFMDALDDFRHTNWFAEARKGGGDIDIIDKLFEEVHIGVLPRTHFIFVSMSGTNAGDIATIVNAISSSAVRDFKATSDKIKNETILLFEQELRRLNTERKGNADELQAMLRQTTLTESTNAFQTSQMMQGELIRRKLEARELYLRAKQAMETIRGKLNSELEGLPEVKQAVMMDRNIQMLQGQETSLKIALASAEDNLLEQHPSVKRYKSQLKAIKLELEMERKRVIEEAIEDSKQNRASFFEQAQENYISLDNQVIEGNKELKDHNVLQERLKIVNDRIEFSSAFIGQLDSRLTDLRLLIRSDWPVVFQRPAVRPHEPSFPKYKIFIPLGIFLGCLFGLGVSFLLELLDTSIKAPSDISRRVELPMLGMIPHLDDVEEEISDLRTAFLTHPNTIICEAFRQIRTSLLFSGPAEQLKTILVTSPMPEDGRTSVSLNLGNHLAVGNKRVLIVDANFRQPAIHQLFPEGITDGLSNVLVGQANWHEMLQEIRPGLFVMSSGPIPPNPVELLGSEQMAEFVGELSEEFDHIIFDTAPLLVVADAAVLSTKTDGTILVIRAGINTYGIAQRARDMLTKLGTHIYGVVLNGVRVRAGGYLRKSYETFYEYKEAAQSPAGTVASKALDEKEEETDA